MKICVYAIAKNEAKFAARWAASMREADEIYVLDTGSEDDTDSILRKHHVHVAQAKINRWTNEYNKLLRASKLPSKLDRAKVSGYHKIKVATEAV